jgi:hypothetical protein
VFNNFIEHGRINVIAADIQLDHAFRILDFYEHYLAFVVETHDTARNGNFFIQVFLLFRITREDIGRVMCNLEKRCGIGVYTQGPEFFEFVPALKLLFTELHKSKYKYGPQK